MNYPILDKLKNQSDLNPDLNPLISGVEEMIEVRNSLNKLESLKTTLRPEFQPIISSIGDLKIANMVYQGGTINQFTHLKSGLAQLDAVKGYLDKSSEFRKDKWSNPRDMALEEKLNIVGIPFPPLNIPTSKITKGGDFLSFFHWDTIFPNWKKNILTGSPLVHEGINQDQFKNLNNPDLFQLTQDGALIQEFKLRILNKKEERSAEQLKVVGEGGLINNTNTSTSTPFAGDAQEDTVDVKGPNWIVMDGTKFTMNLEIDIKSTLTFIDRTIEWAAKNGNWQPLAVHTLTSLCTIGLLYRSVVMTYGNASDRFLNSKLVNELGEKFKKDITRDVVNTRMRFQGRGAFLATLLLYAFTELLKNNYPLAFPKLNLFGTGSELLENKYRSALEQGLIQSEGVESSSSLAGQQQVNQSVGVNQPSSASMLPTASRENNIGGVGKGLSLLAVGRGLFKFSFKLINKLKYVILFAILYYLSQSTGSSINLFKFIRIFVILFDSFYMVYLLILILLISQNLPFLIDSSGNNKGLNRQPSPPSESTARGKGATSSIISAYPSSHQGSPAKGKVGRKGPEAIDPESQKGKNLQTPLTRSTTVEERAEAKFKGWLFFKYYPSSLKNTLIKYATIDDIKASIAYIQAKSYEAIFHMLLLLIFIIISFTLF